MTCDEHDELAVNPAVVSGAELAAVKRVWEILEAKGALAAAEELLRFSHPEVELQSYSARGAAAPGEGDVEVMRGPEEILAFFRKAEREGVSVKARARSFDLDGDSVVVSGSMRVVRGDGSFAEAKLRWSYRFRDGLVDEIAWSPRAG